MNSLKAMVEGPRPKGIKQPQWDALDSVAQSNLAYNFKVVDLLKEQ